jgi:hypothetical protein
MTEQPKSALENRESVISAILDRRERQILFNNSQAGDFEAVHQRLGMDPGEGGYKDIIDQPDILNEAVRDVQELLDAGEPNTWETYDRVLSDKRSKYRTAPGHDNREQRDRSAEIEEMQRSRILSR